MGDDKDLAIQRRLVAAGRRRLEQIKAEVRRLEAKQEAHEAHLEALTRLQRKDGSRNVFSEDMNMSPEARAAKNLKISEKRSLGDPFLEACRRAKVSQNALAEELDISPGSLVAYRNGRAIPERLAKAIQTRIGFVDWPGGIER